MVRRPSTEPARPALSRRRYLALAGVAGAAGTVGVGTATGAEQDSPSPPGVAAQAEYEQLRITGTAPAHDTDRLLVGRRGSRPEPDDPVRIAAVDADGTVRRRRSITPDLPREAHATPDVVRTAEGYAIAAGAWLARLTPDLSVLSIGKRGEIPATERTTLLPVDGGFVVGFTEWLPNAFWTWLVGFDADGAYAWHHQHNVNGSQALAFLVPDGEGGAVAGGTFPWLASVGADGSFERVTLPDGLPDGVLQTGARDGDGLVLSRGDAMARLDADFELDWTSQHDALSDRAVRELVPVDDGFLVRTTAGESGDLTLGKVDSGGELRWHRAYRIDAERQVEPLTLTATGEGEYLVAGGYHLSPRGWILRLSDTVAPESTATPTPTTPATTATADTTPTPSRTATSTPTAEDPTTTTGAGFRVTAACAGVAAALARLLERSE
ncbi:hypothetical protein JCM30237_10180 [Halolamina litorea]|uniref:Uncharacterized protein n=1 Tax=Halolamina litorea TaxID=1515593 RepID=A0ABD6BWJ6_9EURY|nr:hypothetical protein [Halolamina litorea]